jgi:cobalt-zinc-cadmium efflux system membrane fusion protein
LVQGSPVRKGQVIAIVENADFIELEQNFLESKTRLEYAEAEFLRQKELNKENVNSTKTYQLAVSEYKSLKTKVAALDQKLALIGVNGKTFTEEKISGSIPIYSPINGYIKSVNVNIGKFVNPTDVMFEIINNQNLTLELTMYEKDIENVKIGQNISFTSPNKPENNYTAKVYQVGRAINDDKSVKVYANVNGESAGLMSGMYVNAFVESGLNSVTALPNEAIVNFEGKSYIFVSKGKRKEEGKEVNDFLMVEVKRGVSSNGFTEVILPEKFSVELSKVVIKGAYNLLSAMKNAGDMAC